MFVNNIVYIRVHIFDARVDDHSALQSDEAASGVD